MQYIMVTSFSGHWDNIPNNRAYYTVGMFGPGMTKNKIKEDTQALFIKKERRGERAVEGCWLGRVSNFEEVNYGGTIRIYFEVKIEKIIQCPEKYKSYPERWYCEEMPIELQTKRERPANEVKKEIVFPQHVTLSWLFRNVPVHIWIYLVSVIIGAFLLGVYAGQTTFIQELIASGR